MSDFNHFIAGIVLLDNVKWLSFHSGYDFGYLLSLLTNQVSLSLLQRIVHSFVADISNC